MLGPIDYVIIGFEGNNFNGSILDELGKATASDIIRVIDLLFIIKDKDGTIHETEYEDQSPEFQSMFSDFQRPDDLPLLSDSDILKIGQQMDSNTAAGVLVVEHLWAKGLKQAIIDAGGYLIADGRVHAEVVETAMTELATTNASK
jgi:hypothetical protein